HRLATKNRVTQPTGQCQVGAKSPVRSALRDPDVRSACGPRHVACRTRGALDPARLARSVRSCTARGSRAVRDTDRVEVPFSTRGETRERGASLALARAAPYLSASLDGPPPLRQGKSRPGDTGRIRRRRPVAVPGRRAAGVDAFRLRPARGVAAPARREPRA